jgi:D-alanine--poly(phosphoribitol) ligase subunit 1
MMPYDRFLPSLAADFAENANRRGTRLALSVDGTEYSYSELAARARAIGGWLRSRGVGLHGRVGILASRSLESFAGILGTCWIGAAYVPINVGLPGEAVAGIVSRAGLDALIVDQRGQATVSAQTLDLPPERIWVRERNSADTLVDAPLAAPPDATAYIEFTSGTTGVPKGVIVSTRAFTHFISVMHQRYDVRPEDRVAATSDITFDISFANMFIAWRAGASLHVVPGTQLMAPAKFIRDTHLTMWFSVPSIATFMRQMKLLKPGSFPDLRYSLFAGEPLPLESAIAWQAAAPNSTVENLYGPTEATVVCTFQTVGATPVVTPNRGVIAIGRPFPGTGVAIVDPALRFLPPDQEGQIALSGAQLADGYCDQPELTEERFPVIDGSKWYLTGDLGHQDSAGAFHHLGRLDNQVKILGYRVELEGVESHLRQVCNSDMVAAVAWPIEHGSAQGLVAFISGTVCSPSEVREAMKERVVGYMVPKSVHVLDDLPLSSNGKVDRKALCRLLAGNRL